MVGVPFRSSPTLPFYRQCGARISGARIIRLRGNHKLWCKPYCNLLSGRIKAGPPVGVRLTPNVELSGSFCKRHGATNAWYYYTMLPFYFKNSFVPSVSIFVSGLTAATRLIPLVYQVTAEANEVFPIFLRHFHRTIADWQVKLFCVDI